VLHAVSSSSLEVARMQWSEGSRRLLALDVPARERESYERVVVAIVHELSRRVGQTFTLEQLASAYAESEDWCRDVALRTTARVAAHDLSVVQDAAFDRFSRGASDFRS
jgi:hypothetical protein